MVKGVSAAFLSPAKNVYIQVVLHLSQRKQGIPGQEREQTGIGVQNL